MNPNIPTFVLDLYQDIVENPSKAKGLIAKRISKNRSLSSKKRRLYQDWIMEGLRWPTLFKNLQSKQVTTFDVFFDEIKKHIISIEDQIQKNEFNNFEQVCLALDMPLWFVNSISKGFSPCEVAELCLSLHQRASLFVRQNIDQASTEQIQQSLTQEDVSFEKSTLSRYGLKILENCNVQALHAFKKGWIDVQDDSSQFVIDHMGLKKGQKVMDGCARSGGKTLAMINDLGVDANIHVADIDARVFQELDRRVQRAKLKQITKHWIAPEDSSALPKLKEQFDHVLVDAPCSSIGTLKRRPWLKHFLNPEQIASFTKLQQKILLCQSQWVKSKGYITFSTCSFLKEENEDVIDFFVAQNPNFVIAKQTKLYPHQIDSDGFYVCTLQRNQ